MIATLEPRGTRPAEAVIPPGAAEALLVEQLARATRELQFQEALGGRTGEIRAVVRSLRSTIALMAERGSVLDRSDPEFRVKCLPHREPELWHGRQKLPVQSGLLRRTFEKAGVTLEPGQLLVADRDLATRLVEESLVAFSLQELRIREAKNTLLLSLRDPSMSSVP